MTNTALSRTEVEEMGMVESEAMTEDQANEAAIGAEMPGFDAVKKRDRAAIGRYIAKRGIAGNILAEAEVHQTVLEEILLKMRDLAIDGKTPLNQRIAAAKAAKDVSNAAANWAEKQINTGRIVASGKAGSEQQLNAPLTINGTMIQANSVQVNGATTPAVKPVEAVEV